MRSNEVRRQIIENIYTLDEYYSNVIHQHSHFNHVYLTIPIAIKNENYYEF
jgi:hypothetical protein